MIGFKWFSRRSKRGMAGEVEELFCRNCNEVFCENMRNLDKKEECVAECREIAEKFVDAMEVLVNASS